ncbi:MAG: hypothetical protein H6697_08350 [Myxococcales bacterium]|nr:hypothetical protein [Myxococcales bacterium]
MNERPRTNVAGSALRRRFNAVIGGVVAAGGCAGYNLERTPDPVEVPVVVVDPCEGVASEVVTRLSERREAVACGAPVSLGFDEVSDLFEYGPWEPQGVAVFVIDCADRADCDAATQPALLGLALYAATTVEPDDLRAASRSLGEPRADLFTARYAAARQLLDERGAALDAPRREVYVELPAATRTERRTFEARHASEIAQLDALQTIATAELSGGAVADESIVELRELRRAFVAACAPQHTLDELVGCLRGPVARPITRLLVRAEASRGAVGAAHVELDLLSVGPPADTFMSDLAERQTIALAALAPDEREAGARVADAPVAAPPEPDLGEGVGAATLVTGRISRLRAGDAGVRLEFQRVYLEPRAFTCVAGDELRVHWGDRQLELPDCTRGFRSRIRHLPDAITVDAGSADSVVAGEVVEAWVDPSSRIGAVVRAFADESATAPRLVGGFEVADTP